MFATLGAVILGAMIVGAMTETGGGWVVALMGGVTTIFGMVWGAVVGAWVATRGRLVGGVDGMDMFVVVDGMG